jgi:hypothetical protein
MVLNGHTIVTVNKSLAEIDGNPTIQRGALTGTAIDAWRCTDTKSIQITYFHSAPLNISIKTVASPIIGIPMNTNPNIYIESPTFILLSLHVLALPSPTETGA